uniref:WD repeat domain 90 n=1 Tax=Myripristis murdjan TaxID=586833 RepID=A0A667XN02_9TELE
SFWQHPYVNIFKHVRIEEWKKSAKEGDVATYTDKTLKCSVLRIKGPVPASNYILIPKSSSQSLGLTGHYFYLLFRPTPAKYFVVHLDVAAEEGQVVRVSFSNMFKEFKSTATWLQFPFLCGAAKDSVYESTAKSARRDLVGPAPSMVRWTCLMLDLQYILSVYLSRCHSHLKSIKLCANMSVKNMFTTDLLLDPGETLKSNCPMPRDMSFPVPNGDHWHDLYDYIRHWTHFTDLGIFPDCSSFTPCPATIIQGNQTAGKRRSEQQSEIGQLLRHYLSKRSGYNILLLPDPILRLNQIIGFGGASTKCALWTKSGDAVVYPCHAIIVSMKISSSQQRFFIGHTDKVSALAFNGNTTVLASSQTGNHSVVRVWNYNEGNCLAMFRTHTHSLSSLSFSYSGGVLCGVGKDSQNKTMVVAWNTSNVSKGGEVSILAKAHTDVDIHTLKVALFDDTRMVSCGRDNVRLWRMRNGSLRSCPVNLAEYHSLDFTDVAFEEENSADHQLDDRTLFVSSRSGHILEIDYSRVVIKNVRRLQPAQQRHTHRREKLTLNTGPGIAINSISVSSSFCATGSEDGFLRLWPLDFSTVFLEAEHEGPVSLVSVSADSLQVLAATSTGNLGYLDVSSRGYSTLMRSHTDSVLGFSVDGIRRHLTTASRDGTVRIWNMDSLHQLYDFVSEDNPCSVAFHPSLQVFSCGFSSGVVRVFDISTAKLLAEHKYVQQNHKAGSPLSCTAGLIHSVSHWVGNVVARGTERAPDALTVSSDSRCLAFVGPSEYIVTIADARSLDELLRVDVSILDLDTTSLDSALKVCFSPASTAHLLVATSANKILWVSTKTGRLLRQVSKVHKHQCSSLAVSEDSHFLLTAGHNAVKVWDYNMELDVNSQMFIGHSEPIRQVSFTPDQLGVVSVGDAIFLWDFLAHPTESFTDKAEANGILLSSGIPRQSAPLPSSPPPHLDISDIDHSLLELSLNVIFMVHLELKKRTPIRPDCYRHFNPRFKASAAVAPQPGEEGMRLKAVIGYNGNGRGNMVWSPDQGLFMYSCGSVVVVEYLPTGCQRHLLGHTEEISCLAVTNDAQTLASAAGGSSGKRTLICIWDIQNGVCRNTISYHRGTVQSLAFSRDDQLFLSVGDFSEPEVALWSSRTFQLLSSVRMSGPIHDAAFSPSAASQLACVGSLGAFFGLIHTVQRVNPPAELGDVELTSLCYHTDSMLFTATNRGHVCVWDVNTQCCLMTWEADQGEIGVLLCRGNCLLTGSNTRWLRLWEVKAVGALVVLEQEIMLDGTIVSAAFGHAMDMGIVGTTAGTLWYINWMDNSSIRLVSGHKTKVNDMVFSPDESHFATCGEDGSVRVWSAPNNELVVQFQVLNQGCGCVCWSPVLSSSEGSACVVAGYSDGTLRIFQLASAEMEMKLHPHHVAVTAVQYSANGHVILSAGKNGLVAVSSPVNGATVRVIRDHKGAPITAIQCVNKQYKEFGLEGNDMWLAAGADRRVSVWAADWLKDKCDLLDWLTFPAPDDSPPPSLAAFCPADPSLVVYTGYGVEKELSYYSLVKKQVPQLTAPLPAYSLFCMLTGSISNSGRFQDFLHHSDSLQTCHFSPSGRLLFTVAYNEILLWEVQGL